jgi:hypothetical protein
MTDDFVLGLEEIAWIKFLYVNLITYNYNF